MNRLIIACFFCACLFLLIIWMGISTISDMVYNNFALVTHSHKGTNNKEKQQTLESSLSLNERLQQASLENGRKIFRHCAICHTSERNGSRRVGPSLWEIVNRPLANVADFPYSRVFRENSDQKWDFVTLDRFLQAPREVFPGTIMSFRGIENNQDRADLLLYLRSLSDNPVTLPTSNSNKKGNPG
ncbi:c-type cytochrome [Bartonella sp. CB175]|uniref:c-type cytochrome n=1 Tax=Bartonella sp. CB175 TaxID=3112256 RepID=UPI00300E2C4A